MPPSYTKLTILGDVTSDADIVDMRSHGINLIYIPNFLTNHDASQYFIDILKLDVLQQHSYIGSYGRHIKPHRLTYASVPKGRLYRYKGKTLTREDSDAYQNIINQFASRLPSFVSVTPDASISNGYRYNNDDYIALHTDDEKFLQSGNCQYWSEATVCTITLLRDISHPMVYQFGNPDTGVGYRLRPAHGSLLIQGKVLHAVSPATSSIDLRDKVSRISVTLRKLQETCQHGCRCTKISCPVNLGPSNYLYYSNANSLQTQTQTQTQKPRIIVKFRK